MQFHATKVTLILPPSGCSSGIAPGAACVLSACLGLARTAYIRCIHVIFGRETTKYTVHVCGSGQHYTYKRCVINMCVGLATTICIYTVYIRNFWQGNHQIHGHIQCTYAVVANSITLGCECD